MPSMVVSPQLLFNIGLPVCSTTSLRLDCISAVDQDSIPTADEVCLAPVYRHDGFEHPLPEWLFKIVRSHMEDYFNLRGKGRLLYHGDVIGITLDARRWAGRTARLASGENNNSLRLYFKILLSPSMSGEHQVEHPFYVHASRTKCVLLEGSPVNEFVPPILPGFFIPNTIHLLADEISKLLFTLLSNNFHVDITPVLLVVGSEDQQRRLLAYVAGLTGISLVAKNCWSYSSLFLGPSTADSKRKEKLERALECAQRCAPSLIWFRNFTEAFCRGEGRRDASDEEARTLLDVITVRRRISPCFAVVFTCTPEEEASLSKRLLSAVHFKYTMGADALSEEERGEFHRHCSASGRLHQVDRETFVNTARGFSLAEMDQLVDGMCLTAAMAGRQQQPTAADLELGVERRNALLAKRNGALCHATIPRVGWDEVGGLEDAKQLLIESVRALTTADVEGRGGAVRRSGILLHGPPGCGKTMLAKAVASVFKLAFISVKGPELLNRYVGQSESNLRDVFHRARLSSPSIVFFDELDSLAPSRGVAGDSGGVMDRMVSQFLTEMDFSHQRWGNGRVLVIGATNRPDLLDDCLLKPGRFDTLIEVRPATSVKVREQILEPVCKRMNLETSLNARRIAEFCPASLSTGADLALLMSKAGMGAVRERIESFTDVNIDTRTEVVISERHVKSAIEDIIGSREE